MNILWIALNQAIWYWKPNIAGYGETLYDEFILRITKLDSSKLPIAEKWYNNATTNKNERKHLPNPVTTAFQYSSDSAKFHIALVKLKYKPIESTIDDCWPYISRETFILSDDYYPSDLE